MIDTDYGGWTAEVPVPDELGPDHLWAEDRMNALLSEHQVGALFLAGCISNQAKF